MAKIEIILTDAYGNKSTKEYNLDIGSGLFHDIEGAVETFKNAFIPEIEKELLTQQQAEFSKTQKKIKN